ncbi:hypothetical protein GW17_00017933 [Ensete ventricosum]|nr:hypothetical protein GW17_00017933 [Ensete ventricosum]
MAGGATGGDEVKGGRSDDAGEIGVDVVMVLVQHDGSGFWQGRGALDRGRMQQSEWASIRSALRMRQPW